MDQPLQSRGRVGRVELGGTACGPLVAGRFAGRCDPVASIADCDGVANCSGSSPRARLMAEARVGITPDAACARAVLLLECG